MRQLKLCADPANPSRRCAGDRCRCEGRYPFVAERAPGEVALVHLLGSKALRQVARPVKPGEDVSALVRQLEVTMLTAEGIGLSANQIGDPRAIAVVRSGDQTLTFVNPRIVGAVKQLAVDLEGCLSLPGVARRVARFTSVRIEAGVETAATYSLSGLLARAAQHELDHLRGRLIIDGDRASLELPPFRYGPVRARKGQVICPGCAAAYAWRGRSAPVRCYLCEEGFFVKSGIGIL